MYLFYNISTQNDIYIFFTQLCLRYLPVIYVQIFHYKKITKGLIICFSWQVHYIFDIQCCKPWKLHQCNSSACKNNNLLLGNLNYDFTFYWDKKIKSLFKLFNSLKYFLDCWIICTFLYITSLSLTKMRLSLPITQNQVTL